MPVWAPDDRRVAYATGTVQKSTLSIARADGTGVTAVVPCPGIHCLPTDWSPDSEWLLANVPTAAGMDIWLLSTASSGASRPLFAERFVERDARLSPDGRFVAYVSEETGRPEVTVQAVGASVARDVLSVAGGDQPVWSREGRELFFVDLEGALRRVGIRLRSDGRLVIGRTVLVDVPRIGSGHWGTQYDVAPDGQHIFFLDRRIQPGPSEIGIVFGWRALMK
jgi:eukaryotic-like serine/threonine-protein kinase